MCTGKRMKERRKELGIKADEVAEALGCSRSTIFRYENGDIEKVPTTLINTIAEVLKTTPAYLMGWEWDIVPMDLTDIEANIINAYREASPDIKHAVNKFLGVWDNPPEHEDDPTIELQKTVFWEKYYSLDERGRKMVDMVLEQEFEHSKIEAPDLEYPDLEPEQTNLKVAQESVEYTKE